ncbi:adhesin [Mammaliicoccus sciuri]|nr:iron-sulfur cluster biosynthesis family protein [Mammaliicoccus sciuri]MEB7466130.1 adhesin [Mammaliicoccus sciuri]
MRNKMYKCEITDKKGRKIKMNITNEAKEYIQAMLEEQQAKGLRVYAVEGGCCGPQIGLSLDLPEESDTVSVINEISVAIAPQAKGIISVLTLDFESKGEQSGLVMIGAPNNC